MKKRLSGPSGSEDILTLKEFVQLFIPHWRWFVLSLCCCLSIAIVYLLVTPRVYTRTTAVLIKDTDEGSSSSMGDVFQLEFLSSKANINNELISFQSPILMTEVVKRLNLNETYTKREGLRDVELYRGTPVQIAVTNKKVRAPYGFTVELVDAKTAVLSDFVSATIEDSRSIEVPLGTPVSTPFGQVTVTPTDAFSEKYVGEPIEYFCDKVKSVAKYYAANLSVGLDMEDATVIRLSISDTSPEKAEDLLETLIEAYNDQWVSDRNQMAISTSHFIEERLKVIEHELSQVDNNISNYKSANLLPDTKEASTLYMREAVSTKKDLFALENGLGIARYIAAELDKMNLSQLLPANSGLDNASIETQIKDYNTVVLNRNRLLSDSDEQHPLVKSYTEQLQAMQQAIRKSISNHIAILQKQIASVEKQENAAMGQVASTPKQVKYLLSVERQQKVKSGLYTYLLQKREENELSKTFASYNTRIITPPSGSAFPTSPSKRNVLLVALLLGVAIPMLVIFMIHNSNTRVRGRRDVEDLNIPFLGEIPLCDKHRIKRLWKKQPRLRSTELLVSLKGRDALNEAFRVVRTNIEFMNGQQDIDVQVLLTSSFNPGSGKTFVTANLAASFALKGKRVIIVDLDLRRSALSQCVASPASGLSNYLAGFEEDWKTLVKTVNFDVAFDVLPAGATPPNPTELLFVPRLAELLADLRQTYDLIFIDCPPIDIVADTSIIARHADLSLFIVRQGLLERELLPQIDTYYEKKTFGNMALILNGADNENNPYGRHVPDNYYVKS